MKKKLTNNFASSPEPSEVKRDPFKSAGKPSQVFLNKTHRTTNVETNEYITNEIIPYKVLAITTGSDVELDVQQYQKFFITVTNSLNISFINLPPIGEFVSITVVIIQDAIGDHKISFSETVKWLEKQLHTVYTIPYIRNDFRFEIASLPDSTDITGYLLAENIGIVDGSFSLAKNEIIFYTTSSSADWQIDTVTNTGSTLIWEVENYDTFINNVGHLDLSWNTSNLPVKVIVTSGSELVGLTKIIFRGHTITALKKIKVPTLLELEIKDLDLSTDTSFIFTDLPTLRKLKVTGCKLQTFPNISSCVLLKTLELQNNEIQGSISTNAFTGLLNLEIMYLYNNYIVGAFPSLICNSLNDFDFKHNVFNSFPNLVSNNAGFDLDLEYNCMSQQTICNLFIQLDSTLTGSGNVKVSNAVSNVISSYGCPDGYNAFISLLMKGYNISIKKDVSDVNCPTSPP